MCARSFIRSFSVFMQGSKGAYSSNNNKKMNGNNEQGNVHTREWAEDDANAIAIVTIIVMKYIRAGQKNEKQKKLTLAVRERGRVKEKQGNHICSCHRLTFNLFSLPIWYIAHIRNSLVLVFRLQYSLFFFSFHIKILSGANGIRVCIVHTRMYVILIFIEFQHSLLTHSHSFNKRSCARILVPNLLNCTQQSCTFEHESVRVCLNDLLIPMFVCNWINYLTWLN